MQLIFIVIVRLSILFLNNITNAFCSYFITNGKPRARIKRTNKYVKEPTQSLV